MNNLYNKAFLGTQKRLLNLLDKNPLSDTYGCFDRSFWLHRKTDFPTSTAQLSARTLAYFYKYKLDASNQFYQNKSVLLWIIAALEYTLKIQNSDGSYDEWYPNERGWGGPTGYIVSSLSESYLLLQDQFSDELKNNICSSIKKSIEFLLIRDEFDILTNHYAIVLNAITLGNKIINEPKFNLGAEKILNKIISLYSPEGWSLEYDGCDLGYNLGTLNFLADIYEINKDPRILEIAKKAFHFLSYFMTPDGQWVSNLSSRHTIHNYYFAVEYWSHHCSTAQPLLFKLRNRILKNLDLLPSDQEDHYLHYRVHDYIKAHLYFKPLTANHYPLPTETHNFLDVEFPESGFYVKKYKDCTFWMSTKRGGAIALYNKNLYMNNGVLFIDSKNNLYSNLWQSSNKTIDCLHINAKCTKLFNHTFRPFTFLTFRFALLFFNFSGLAYLLKKVIRNNLITFKTNQAHNLFCRKITFTDTEIILNDQLTTRFPIRKLFYGGNFHTRYVPQGHYYQDTDINLQPQKIKLSSDLSKIQLWTHISLENLEAKICVE